MTQQEQMLLKFLKHQLVGKLVTTNLFADMMQKLKLLIQTMIVI